MGCIGKGLSGAERRAQAGRLLMNKPLNVATIRKFEALSLYQHAAAVQTANAFELVRKSQS